MTARLMIVADDLSGAADCAVSFARCLPTTVVFGPDASAAAGVTAVDLDSRRLPADQAAACHEALLQSAMAHQAPLYKKIDSTLRGNVAAEIAALRPRGLALVAPAYPAMGRTTRGGVQHVHGVPVNETDVWANENLSGSANLQAMLENEGLRCGYLTLERVRAAGTLAEDLSRLLAEGFDAVVCDAETDRDLQALAHASAALHDRLFWVGSAGLALQLPAALAFPEAKPLAACMAHPVLTVVGSMSQHSQRQAAFLAAQSGQLHLSVKPSTLLDCEAASEREALVARIRSTLANGRDLLLSVSQEDRDPARAASISGALGALVQPCLDLAGALIATGGETARSILALAGLETLRVRGEITPGVVLSAAADRDLLVVTKAGGFGDTETLYSAWQALHQNAAPAPGVSLTCKESHHV